MSSLGVFARFCAVLCLFILTGCVGDPATSKFAMSSTISAEEIEKSSDRIERIMVALARDSGGSSYYEMTEAGFNFVDDRCMIYFNQLFHLNRRRDAAKAGLNAFGQTTNAILTATGASALSMAVVTQAFGLASNLSDIVAGTYLYQLPPATTLSFVRKLQGAYREAAYQKRAQVNSRTTAYHLIQEYLSLCLPPVIEAKLVEHVADAAAEPNSGGSISNIKIRVESERNVERAVVADAIERADSPLPKPEGPVLPKWAKNQIEAGLKASEINAFQRQLCVPEADRIDDTTRAAMDEFFTGVTAANPARVFRSVRESGITGSQLEFLRKAVRMFGAICNPANGDSAKEFGKLAAD